MRWPGGRGACLSDARESAPRASDKAYTSNPVLIGHYLNWPGCATSTEGGAALSPYFVSLKYTTPSPTPAYRNEGGCLELSAIRQQKLTQLLILNPNSICELARA